MKKVLIANRGEIAVRIIRACHDLGLETVAVFSEADRESLHVLLADEAICIGPAQASKSYLKSSQILSVCEMTGADAVHPGYGFLSENADFAALCEECGLIFIGPSSKAIASLGDKAQAKDLAKSVRCPVIPGSEGVAATIDDAIQEAKRIGFPILVKATKGGGGKGIRFASNEDELKKSYIAAKTEAEAAFGCGDVYLEKMILEPRHVEIQVAADRFGNTLHFGERDCTIQRRRQKLIEEAPSPRVTDSLRKKMGEAAKRLIKAAKYTTVGTVEFLLDANDNFYFMEVNTRIQVEHTVTEEVTGIDLVALQIQLAMGEKLKMSQRQIQMHGHVIQYRINAEDPANQFMPQPMAMEYYIAPGGPHVRVDSACYSGYKIPPYYDSMIAKLIVKGSDRDDAIKKSRRALKEFIIGGPKTTIPFHLYMLNDKTFLGGDYPIQYIDRLVEEGVKFNAGQDESEDEK